MHTKHFLDTGIASLAGELPDFIPVLLSRENVTELRTQTLLDALRPLGADRNTAQGARGRLFFSVGGWDDDPRPLCAIAEFQRFSRALLDLWPAFGWFVCLSADPPDGIDVASDPEFAQASDSAALQWFAAGGCLAPLATPGTADGRAEAARHRYALIQGMLAIASRHDVPTGVVTRRLHALEVVLSTAPRGASHAN